MRRYNITPYEGNQPYIFVSYAHKDADIVYPIVEELNRRGYRVWYDDGIAPGNEWPEDIAQHLDGCHLAISMLSPRYIVSDNCRRELTFALSKRKSFLAVFLEPTELSLGLEMQLSAQLCVMKYNYTEEESFYKKLCTCPDIIDCHAERELVTDKKAKVGSTERLGAASPVPQKAKKPWVLLLVGAALIFGIAAAVVLPKLIGGWSDSASLQEGQFVSGEEDIPVVLGDETNLDYSLYGSGASAQVTISGVWGDQKKSLNHFVIPETISDCPVTTIKQYAFNSCLGLRAVTIPDSVTKMEMYAFNCCIDLEYVNLSNALTSLESKVFCGCTSLKEITIPESVAVIGDQAFSRSGLERIAVPDSVGLIGVQAFADCENLKQVVLSESVVSIERETFSGCKSLKDIALPDSLSSIEYRMFYECESLESIRIPRSVKSIGNEAFYGCDSLRDIYYEGTEEEWEQLLSEIDFNYPETTPSLNNMALLKAEVHFNA